jgi:phospholipase/carboxylesterase
LRQRPAYDAEQALLVESEQLARARRAVSGVLTTIRERYRPEALFIAGFSQGAMLALDVALQPSSHVDRVAVLSGALPVPTSEALKAARAKRPAVFVSHGRRDRVLRYTASEHLVQQLEAARYSVAFRPFDGGHEIPAETREALRDFFAL